MQRLASITFLFTALWIHMACPKFAVAQPPPNQASVSLDTPALSFAGGSFSGIGGYISNTMANGGDNIQFEMYKVDTTDPNLPSVGNPVSSGNITCITGPNLQRWSSTLYCPARTSFNFTNVNGTIVYYCRMKVYLRQGTNVLAVCTAVFEVD